MKISNIVLAALLLIQGVVIIINPSSKPRFTIQTVKMYPDLKSKEIERITVTEGSGKHSVTLTKRGDKWLIKEAFGYEADKSKVDEILAFIPKLNLAKEVSSNASMFGSYNLAEDNKEMVLTFASKGTKDPAVLYIGKSVIRGTFLRKKGDDKVYSVNASMTGALFTSPTEYMKDTSLQLPMGKERTRISLTYKGDTLTFRKTKEGGPTMGPDGQMTMKEDEWSLLSVEEEPETSADATEIKNLVGSLDNLMFDTVEAAKDSGTFGFAKPHISLTIGDGKKVKKQLIVGDIVKGKKSHRYAKVTGSPFVYGLDAYKFEKWQKVRTNYVKTPVKKPEFGADGKLPKMELPKAGLKLTVPGIADPKKAKEAVIYPSKP